jgi:gliding motility-associated-like protein
MNIDIYKDLTRISGIFLLAIFFSIQVRAQYTSYGDANALSTDCYRLTADVSSQAGAIASTKNYSLDSDFVVSATLNFGTNTDGADGIAFIMIPDKSGLSGPLQSGGSIGYGGLANALVIEFDTYQNTDKADPAFDHIALMVKADAQHTNNTVAGPFRASDASDNIKDGRDHDVLIIWEAKLQLLTLYFDCKKIFGYQGTVSRPFLGGSKTFYAGFTSSTGIEHNEHTVCFKKPQFVDALKDQTYCDSARIVLEGGGNGRKYDWSPVQYFSDPHAARPEVFVDKTTTFYLHKFDNCGNETYDSMTVTIIPNNVNISLGRDTSICDNASITLTVPTPGLNYSWSTGETGQSIIANGPGTYAVTVDDGICKSRDEILISQKLTPQISLPGDTTLCDHDPYTLTVHAGGNPVLWSDGSTDSTFIITEPGKYSVEASNACGSTSAEISVNYENCSLYFIPNVFSPNHDGVNDYFGPSPSPSISTVEYIGIFNRWGDLVFEADNIASDDEKHFWDGNFKGKYADVGVYAYLIRLRMKNGKIINAKGSVTLLR